jgi:tryptophan synthase alpha chain
MPYLMGGFPTWTLAAIGEAYADGGADLVELGVPFSDPLADGPVIQAAGTAALRAGRDRAACSRSARARRARPGRAHVLRQPRARARRRALRGRLAGAARAG